MNIILKIMCAALLSIQIAQAALSPENMQQVLQCASAAHTIARNQHVDTVSAKHTQIIADVQASMAQAMTAFQSTVKINELKAFIDFTQAVLTLCARTRIGHGFIMPLPTSVPAGASSDVVNGLLKRAIVALEGYADRVCKKPLYLRMNDTIFCNYVTTRFIPNTLMYVVAPLLAAGYGAKAIYHLPWREIAGNDLYDFSSYAQYYHDRAVKRFWDGLPNPTQNFAKALALWGISYYAGKAIMKVQEQRYLDIENKKQKNALIESERARVKINSNAVQQAWLIKLKARLNALFGKQSVEQPRAIPANLKQAAEYLYNPLIWWKSAMPGTRGFILSGSAHEHGSVVKALAHEINVPYIEMSFLQASYREKVQAMMDRAQAYAMTQPNKAIILHIDNIDHIAAGSKAAKNIAQILFNAQNNPCLNILIVGSVQDRSQIAPELMQYFV